ncbi:protein kinase domain-containing protein [Blastopirellula marina]|uniref:non-specific serine/threonine protein kinase n=1 Tax=Blastopirellula marina TaxID=124 RepID=A0A2S8GR21_9BACT|nr:family 16 glycoside hydrolase [Blastopirellula marina]PQO46880.1 hypothetical protein C5Y93_06940 [Blastopirellula marina]
MKIDERVLDLLLRWEAGSDAEQSLDAVELAGGDPKLAQLLQQHIGELQRVAWLNRDVPADVPLEMPSMEQLGNSLLLPDDLELEQLQAFILKAEILEPEKLSRLVDTRSPKNAIQLSNQLLEESLLTRFQLRAISHGKTRGLKLGRYVILDKIGEGGMGQVYRAWHSRMDREVALKVLPRAAMSKDDGVARFNQEVQVASQLSHPNIVTAFDADEAEGLHFLVMEFVNGKDLSTIVRREGPLSVERTIDYITQAARGLEYAHGVGLVHRDIKPANLLLDEDGMVKILDMGIARMDGSDHTNLTQNGAVMGTVDFMSPEQAIDAKSVDGRADIYSLGCTLYFLLTRRPPFGGDTIMARLLAHRDVLPPKLHGLRKDVPPALELIYQKCMAKRPEDRYADASKLIADLELIGPQASPGDGSQLRLQRPEAELDTASPVDDATQQYLGVGLIVAPKRSLANLPKTSLGLPGRWGGYYAGLVGLLLLFVGGYFAVGPWFGGHAADGRLAISIDAGAFADQLHDRELTLQSVETDESVYIRLDSPELSRTLAPGTYRFVLDPQSGIKPDVSEVTIASAADSPVRITWNPTTADKAASLDENSMQNAAANQGGGASRPAATVELPPKFANVAQPWVDLLSTIKLPDHVIFGNWQRNGDVLIGTGGIHRRVMAPYAVRGDYQLEVEFTRDVGNEAIGLHLPVADTSCDLVLSGWSGTLSGLRKIDGANLDRQPRHTGSLHTGSIITSGKQHKVLVQVKMKSPEEANIAVALDNMPLIDWTGKTDSLCHDEEAFFPLVQSPGLFSFRDRTQFQSFRIRSLGSGEGTSLGDDWGSPYFPVADAPPSYLEHRCVNWNGKSYYRSQEVLSLTEAQRLAKKYHGRLLTISSPAEQEFIFARFRGQPCWLSGWRPSYSNQWRDERNRQLTYLGKWAPGQPDSFSNTELVLGLYYPSAEAYGWNDYAPYNRIYAILEWGDEEADAANAVAGDSDVAPWESIFNGRDLTGWTEHGPGGWRVEDGQIVVQGNSYGDSGWLMLDKQFDAYELEFEYSLSTGGNSGVFLDGTPDKPVQGSEFLEVQLLDDDAPRYQGLPQIRRTGSLYDIAAASVLTPAQKTTWKKVRVRFDGKTAAVYLNDALVMRHQLSRQYATGHIGLQKHTGLSAFRNLRVRELREPIEEEEPHFALQPNGPWIDLLPLIKIPEHEQSGTWRQRDTGLLGIGGGKAHIVIPYAVKGSYQLEAEITRVEGNKGLAIHLPIDSHACDYVLSSTGGPVRGFQFVDLSDIHQHDPASGLLQRDVDLTNGKSYKLEIKVQRRGEDEVQLSATLDGERVAYWTGNIRRLSQTPAVYFPVASLLGVYLNETSAEFHSLKLRHLGSGEGQEVAGDWQDPYCAVADQPPASVIKDCKTWGGRYYYSFPERLPLESAQRLAVALQGRLLTVSSPAEEAAIRGGLANNTIWTAGWRRGAENVWYDERNRRVPYLGDWETGVPFNGRPLEQFMAIRNIPSNPYQPSRSERQALPPSYRLRTVIEWGSEYPANATPRTYSPEARPFDLDPQLGSMLQQLERWDVTPAGSVAVDGDGYLRMTKPDSMILTKRTDWGNVDVRFVLSAAAGTEAFLIFEKRDGFAITSSVRDVGQAIGVGYQGRDFGARESGHTKGNIPYRQDFELRFRTQNGSRWIDVNGAISSGVGWQDEPNGAVGILLKKGSLTIKRVEFIQRNLN